MKTFRLARLVRWGGILLLGFIMGCELVEVDDDDLVPEDFDTLNLTPGTAVVNIDGDSLTGQAVFSTELISGVRYRKVTISLPESRTVRISAPQFTVATYAKPGDAEWNISLSSTDTTATLYEGVSGELVIVGLRGSSVTGRFTATMHDTASSCMTCEGETRPIVSGRFYAAPL